MCWQLQWHCLSHSVWLPKHPHHPLRTHLSQTNGCLHFTYTSMQKRLQQKRNSVLCKYSHRRPSYLHYLFVPPVFPCLLPGFTHCEKILLKILLKIQQRKRYQLQCLVYTWSTCTMLSAGICWSPSVGTIFYITQASTLSAPPWIRTNTAQQHCSDKLKIFKANLISHKSSVCQHRTCNTK